MAALITYWKKYKQIPESTLAIYYSLLFRNVSENKKLFIVAQMTGLAFKHITVSLKLSKRF